jgi:predicted nucleic acid-binding protein
VKNLLRYLLDTNILLRYADKNSSYRALVAQALATLAADGAELYLAPQNLYEFWNVATRPVSVNGLGFSVQETATLLIYFKNAFTLLPETTGVFDEWERLAQTHRVVGKQAHDCRLVAFMRVHHLSHLLTFNAGDFRRFEAGENIFVVEPSALLPPHNGNAS